VNSLDNTRVRAHTCELAISFTCVRAHTLSINQPQAAPTSACPSTSSYLQLDVDVGIRPFDVLALAKLVVFPVGIRFKMKR
jgi:hypothetical protein